MRRCDIDSVAQSKVGRFDGGKIDLGTIEPAPTFRREMDVGTINIAVIRGLVCHLPQEIDVYRFSPPLETNEAGEDRRQHDGHRQRTQSDDEE